MEKASEGKRKPVLLAVLAHPDDESFGMGGTLALYAQRGVDTYLICATRGEAGEVDASHLEGYEDKAARREVELRCAAEHLGLKEVFFLGYRDSGMEGSPENQNPSSLYQADVQEVALRIAQFVRRLRPDVLITFDPIGGYRHPDHIQCHLATVKAFELAADPNALLEGEALPPFRPAKLYFQTIPHQLMRLVVRMMPLFGRDPSKFGQNQDIDLRSIVAVDFPVHAVIDYRPVAALRDEASRCHASQGGGSLTGGPLIAQIRRRFMARETFMRAYPEPVNGRVERDLFEGISF
jgi:LmbE family N-acetylglucosaminyl deacetylase